MEQQHKHSTHRASAVLLWLLSVLILATLIEHAPPWQRLQAVRIHLEPGDELTLGKIELAAAAATSRHMKVGRGSDGWWIQNIASEHKLLLSNGPFQPVRQWQLKPGDQIRIGNLPIDIHHVEQEALRFSIDRQQLSLFEYNNRTLYRTGLALPLCRETETLSFTDEMKSWSLLQRGASAITLGGAASCGTNIALDAVPHRALQLYYQSEGADPGWQLRPGPRFSLLDLPITLLREGKRVDLRDLRQPLENGSVLIAGYSRFDVETDGNWLTIIPRYRSQRVLEKPDLDSRVQQIWQSDNGLEQGALNPGLGGGSLLTLLKLDVPLLASGALLLAALPLAYRWSRRQATQPGHRQSIHLSLLISMTGASFLPFIIPLPPWLVLANLLLASLAWALQPVNGPAAGRVRFLCLALFALGTATQLQLALGAPQSHWYSHLNKTAGLCAAVCWGIIALDHWRRHHKPSLCILDMRWRWLILATLALLALQWQVGYEGGLGAFQPVELAKTVLIIITAAALSRRLDLLNRDYYLSRLERWGSELGVLLLFLAVFAILLMQLNDHSPLVLMTFWAAATFAAYIYLANTGIRRFAGLLAPALLILTLAGTSIERDRIQNLELLPQNDRFAVWAQPELHPHSGYQFRTAREMIQLGGAQGHYIGALQRNKPHIENGQVMAVPAVQDDFMPTFFLHHSGALIAGLLVLLQCLVIHALLLSGQVFRRSTLNGDYRQRALGNFLYLALAGGAGMLAGHFTVSWGSNLGFLPVMGQPMPLLSSAGSNLILFCAPLLAAAYLSAKKDD